MALSVEQITASAKCVIALANGLKASKVTSKEFSEYNGVTDPGWASLGANVPAAVDANGYVVGTSATPADISAAIGSINVFLNFWFGQAVTTSAWGQNLEKLSTPLV